MVAFGGDLGAVLELSEKGSILIVDQDVFEVEVPIDDLLLLEENQVIYNVSDETEESCMRESVMV